MSIPRPHRGGEPLELLESRVLLALVNDPLYDEQFLADAGVEDAWSQTTGSASVVVADIDTGADYTHQDLYANIWINQAEIPASLRSKLRDVDGDGVISFYDLNSRRNRSLLSDVNGNGVIDAADLLSPASQGGWEDGVNGQSNGNDVYTDDIIGWDFAEGDNDPFDDGSSNEGHGTHTAGIIGAQGNNRKGISGVVQKVAMMLVRIFNDVGQALSGSSIAEAIRYSADSGARVSNNSWGGSWGYNGDEIYNAIAYAGSKGQLFVTAAGNSSRNLDSPFANSYPAEYELDNIVVVSAASEGGGSLAYFSNYGSSTVDLAAPGDEILSTLPANAYGRLSGTSMSTPFVTGTAALMLAADPSLTASELKSRLLDGADESTALNNRSVSDGQLNAGNAVLARAGTDVPDDAGQIIGWPGGFRPPRMFAIIFADGVAAPRAG